MKINDVISEGFFSDLILKAVADRTGGGNPEQRIAAASKGIATRSLPLWLARVNQLNQALSRSGEVLEPQEYADELIVWLQNNVTPNRMSLDEMEPKWQRMISQQINKVATARDQTALKQEWEQLIMLSALARPTVNRAAMRVKPKDAVEYVEALVSPGVNLTPAQWQSVGKHLMAKGLTQIDQQDIQRHATKYKTEVEDAFTAMGIQIV